MQVTDILIEKVALADWNANEMPPDMKEHLRRSITRFGLVVPLVVRTVTPNHYETIGGAQRLAVLREIGVRTVPCVVVEADDGEARLLSQALNQIAGSDDPGSRAALLGSVLKTVPEAEVLSILPETADSLRDLAAMGQEGLAEHLQKWQQTQTARLKHLQFQLTKAQLEVVQEALARVMPQAYGARRDNPNIRGTALYILCRDYLRKEDDHEQ